MVTYSADIYYIIKGLTFIVMDIIIMDTYFNSLGKLIIKYITIINYYFSFYYVFISSFVSQHFVELLKQHSIFINYFSYDLYSIYILQ